MFLARSEAAVKAVSIVLKPDCSVTERPRRAENGPANLLK